MNLRPLLPENPGLLYAAFAFSQGIGLLSFWTLPLAAGALMAGLGMGAAQVGMIGAVEFSGLFIASLLLANRVGRGRRKRVAAVAVVLAAGANVLCGALGLAGAALVGMRFVAGLGAGLALAVGNAAIANARDTEKLSGHLTLALVVFMVVVMPILARVSDRFGYQGVFLALGVIVLLGAASLAFLPDGPQGDLACAAGEAEARGGLPSLLGAAVLLVALLFGARGTLPWLVAEQLGLDAGLTRPQVGDLFSLMYAVSILGPAALLILARIAGARAILFWSMLLAGFCNWLFTVSAGAALQFSVGIIAWATLYFLAFAQINAVAALVDRKGRLASAVGSAFIAGAAVAPFIGGRLVERGGYAWLGAAEIILTACIAVIVLAGIPGSLHKPGPARPG